MSIISGHQNFLPIFSLDVFPISNLLYRLILLFYLSKFYKYCRAFSVRLTYRYRAYTIIVLHYAMNYTKLNKFGHTQQTQKNACHKRANAKIKFCVCNLNQWLNEYTVAGSLSVGAS